MKLDTFQKIVPLILCEDSESYKLGANLLRLELSNYKELLKLWFDSPISSMRFICLQYVRDYLFPDLCYSVVENNFI